MANLLFVRQFLVILNVPSLYHQASIELLDEISSISSIYPEETIPIGSTSIEIRVKSPSSSSGQDGEREVVLLRMSFPSGYPRAASPDIEVSAPFLRGEQKAELVR